MAILTKRETWRKDVVLHVRRSPDALSPEESANVRRALAFLRTRAGSTAKLAAQLGIAPHVVGRALWKGGKPGAGLALRAARLAGVDVEVVLRGEWPKEGTCPHCGRK